MPVRNDFKPGPDPGTVLGKLTVLRAGDPILESNRQRVPTSVCQCECGQVLAIRNYVLTRKRSPARSCGCTRKHGHAGRQRKSRTYNAWINMKTRCRRDFHYNHVNICETWLNSYEAFVLDMGECPRGMTLDRIDTNGNYEPSNCRWATAKQQQNNRSNNRTISVGGITRTVAEWMEFHGMDASTFYRRLRLGWTEQEAAGTPKLARHASWGRCHEA